jgi:hypothetical protein
MIQKQSKRCLQAVAHAHALRLKHSDETSSAITPDAIKSYLHPSQIVGEDGDLLVTEAGFVTMAISMGHATQHEALIAIPGCDEKGRFGYLVLGAGKLPYHSLANSARKACEEALGKQQLASALIQYFGNKPALYAAVRKAPVFQRCTREDLEASGLCLWGAESFLGRLGLLSIARRYGLPKFMLLLAGNYGQRIIAASVMRTSTVQKNQIPVFRTQEG